LITREKQILTSEREMVARERDCLLEKVTRLTR
jgi:hypothetical protein